MNTYTMTYPGTVSATYWPLNLGTGLWNVPITPRPARCTYCRTGGEHGTARCKNCGAPRD